MGPFNLLMGLARAGLALCISAGTSAAFYSVFVEPRWIESTYLRVPIFGLPPLLDGFTIAHLTDLHICRYFGRGDLDRAVGIANGFSADIVVLTGDFVTRSKGFRRYLPDCQGGLGGLKSRYGVYAVLGNHDHGNDPRDIARMLEDAGIILLNNFHRKLDVGGAPLWIVGVDDWKRGKCDLERAFDGVPPDGVKILLSHSPDIVRLVAPWGVHLMLCGHTHGGQVHVPPFGAVITSSRYGKKYSDGLFREGDMRIYVNRGIGMAALPIRFLCRPEVALLRLERENKE
ncbi:MAG: metallophosphoesterase [bacterium]